MFEKLKGVTRAVRNLPEDPVVDPNAPTTEPEPDATKGLTCPSCGASFDLQAVSKPSAAPAPPTPQQAPVGGGPSF